MSRKALGVSVVICTYNGAKRLPLVLAYLTAQRVSKEVCWEVIVIDNASQDSSAQVALAAWPASSPAPIRVVHEPQLGLSYARQRALQEARCPIISFVDDDNWVDPDWIQIVSEAMSYHPEVGACGGYSEAVCETNPPPWFDLYKGNYAIGTQGNGHCDVTWSRGFVWGCGLSVRRSAWMELAERGFRFLLTGRQGEKLRSGEDSELCLALRLAGWRIWYEPRLQLKHFIPAERLNWTYLRRLHRGFGASTVGHDPYRLTLNRKQESRGIQIQLERNWWGQILLSLLDAFLNKKMIFLKSLIVLCFLSSKRKSCILVLESWLGRFFKLIEWRNSYRANFLKVKRLLGDAIR